MSDVGLLSHLSSRQRPVRQIDDVWLVGIIERLIAVLFLFIITGGVVRLLLLGEDADPDTMEHVGKIAVLMTRQTEVAETSAFGRLLSVPIYGAVMLVVLVSWPQIWAQLQKKKPTLALVVLAFASSFWSVDPSSTVRRASGLALCTTYGVYLALRFGTEGLLRLLALTFTTMAVLSLVFVAVLPSMAIMDNGAWRGIFTHKNSLGNVMSWGTIVCLAAAASPQNRRLALIGLPIMAVPLFFSQSMTAISSAVIVSILMIGLWLCRRVQSLTPLLISGGACVLGLLTLTNLFSLSGDAMGSAIGKDSTLTGRTELWEAAWWWIQQNLWFGYGYGAFWTPAGPGLHLQQMIAWPAPNAHNGLLEVWLGLGAIGMAAIVVFLVRMAYEAVTAYRRQRGIEQIACIGVLMMTLLVNSTESALLGTGIEWMIAVASLTAARSFRECHAARGAD
jgi:O-antigen ligase